MAKMNMVEKLSIEQCAKLISVVGTEITVVLKSEPGCGKTSILSLLAERNGDQWRKHGDVFPTDKYLYIYVDCPVKDLSDICMNIPVHANKQLECYVSELFQMNDPRPKIILLDELMKAPKMLQIIFTRMMLERDVGDVKLSDGSIVFATSNNASDSVGDTMMAHAGNRVMIINMKKPDHKEWGLWATNNGVSALSRAWVAMNTSALNSYTDLTDDELRQNPFIFNPAKTALSFVSPRSLFKNDVTVRNRHILGDSVTRAGMAGTIGQAAAESMASFFLIEKDLMPIAQILADPKGVAVPTNMGALLMILFNAVDEINTQDELSGFMEFVLRLKNVEIQSVFYTMVCQSKRTVRLAKNNKMLSEWMVKNFSLFT
jgi:hypothetical protein